MPVALPALDLLAWCLFLVAFVLAIAAVKILKPIFQVIQDATSFVPFAGGWVKHATNKVIVDLEAVVVASRYAMAVLWQGFLWAARLTVTVTEEAFGDVESYAEQLYSNALPVAFSNLYADAQALSAAVESDVRSLAGTVAGDVHDLRIYADHAAGTALTTAENYADGAIADAKTWTKGKIADAVSSVESDISSAKAAAISTAENYANALRVAIEQELAKGIAGVETELGGDVSRLQAAIAGAQSAVEGELATAKAAIEGEIVADVQGLDALIASGEAALSAAIAAATAAESAALAGAVSTLQGAIADVRSSVGAIADQLAAVGATAAGELQDIYGLDADSIRRVLDRLDLSKVVDLGAGLVLVRALTEAIAAEAGLDSAACRSKVKGVCSVDASAWAGLLASLAAVGLAFDLRQLVSFAETLAEPARAIIERAAP